MMGQLFMFLVFCFFWGGGLPCNKFGSIRCPPPLQRGQLTSALKTVCCVSRGRPRGIGSYVYLRRTSSETNRSNSRLSYTKPSQTGGKAARYVPQEEPPKLPPFPNDRSSTSSEWSFKNVHDCFSSVHCYSANKSILDI